MSEKFYRTPSDVCEVYCRRGFNLATRTGRITSDLGAFNAQSFNNVSLQSMKYADFIERFAHDVSFVSPITSQAHDVTTIFEHR